MDAAGGWRTPTMDEVLAVLRGESTNLLGSSFPSDAGVAFIRQIHETRTQSELEEFSSKLGDILLVNSEYLSPENETQVRAVGVLTAAMNPDPAIVGAGLARGGWPRPGAGYWKHSAGLWKSTARGPTFRGT